MTFVKRQTWSDIRSMNTPFVTRSEDVVVSYPMFPKEHSPKTGGVAVWQAAARGEYDHHHAAAAANLVRYSRQVVIRLGWEWNRDSFPWSCTDVALAPYYTRSG